MCFFLLNENLICMFDLVYHSMACNAGKNRKQNDFLNFMYGNYIMRNEAKSRFIFYWYRRKIKKNCDYSQMDPWLILINPESDKNSSKKEANPIEFFITHLSRLSRCLLSHSRRFSSMHVHVFFNTKLRLSVTSSKGKAITT